MWQQCITRLDYEVTPKSSISISIQKLRPPGPISEAFASVHPRTKGWVPLCALLVNWNCSAIEEKQAAKMWLTTQKTAAGEERRQCRWAKERGWAVWLGWLRAGKCGGLFASFARKSRYFYVHLSFISFTYSNWAYNLCRWFALNGCTFENEGNKYCRKCWVGGSETAGKNICKHNTDSCIWMLKGEWIDNLYMYVLLRSKKSRKCWENREQL